jgi:hypothetical protein
MGIVNRGKVEMGMGGEGGVSTVVEGEENLSKQKNVGITVWAR